MEREKVNLIEKPKQSPSIEDLISNNEILKLREQEKKISRFISFS